MRSCGSVSSRYSAGRKSGRAERVVRARDVSSKAGVGSSSSSDEPSSGLGAALRLLPFSDCFLRTSSRSLRFLRDADNCLGTSQ